jgi:predicted hotdog family 3-hydroxylacyl-ACP dehydratase
MMIEDLVPHRYPVLLVEKLISHQKDEIVCQVDWRKAQFFHDRNGDLLAVSMPEMVAQAAALMYGLQTPKQEATPALRMLAAIKQFSFYSLPEQNVLQVKVRVHTSLGLHQVVYGKIYEGEKLLAEGMVFLFCKSPE